MPPSVPSGTNTFIPNSEATGGLLVGYSRNVRDFAVNRYLQMTPVSKSVFYFGVYTSQEAMRIRTPDDAEHLWADGADAPTGVDEVESWEWKLASTQRRAYPFRVGAKAVDQADWNVLGQYSKDAAQKAMTARTILARLALTNVSWGTHTANIDGGTSPLFAAGANFATGSNGLGTEKPPVVLAAMNNAMGIINQDTQGTVQPGMLAMLMNPNVAMRISQSPELRDYLKQSPYALAQVRGDVPNQNGTWGLPDTLYGYPVIVDSTVFTMSKRGAATVTTQYVYPDSEMYLITLPGTQEGIEGSTSFSTFQMYYYQDELTVESRYDDDNRRYKGRVVSDYVIQVPSPVSAFRYTRIFGV